MFNKGILSIMVTDAWYAMPMRAFYEGRVCSIRGIHPTCDIV